MEKHTGRIAQADDPQVPERAKRGNSERPDRVPMEGQEGAVHVGDDAWDAHERRRSTARGHLDERGPQE